MNKSYIPTPRTDAATFLVKGPNAWSPYDYPAVSIDFACELERELAKAQTDLAASKEVTRGLLISLENT